METGNVRSHERVTNLIKPASARTAKHLQELVRTYIALKVARLVVSAGDDHRAGRKIYPGGQPHRCHDNSQLASFRQRLNHAGANGVAETAVVIGHPASQKLR